MILTQSLWETLTPRPPFPADSVLGDLWFRTRTGWLAAPPVKRGRCKVTIKIVPADPPRPSMSPREWLAAGIGFPRDEHSEW